METNGKIKIDDGLYLKPNQWYFIKIARSIANTLFGFSVGAGVMEMNYGHIPVIGPMGMAVTIVVKNVLNDMLEWKAKYDLPDNTLSTKSTTVQGNTILQSETIQKIDNPIVEPDKDK